MKAKILSLTVAALMVAGIFAGCNNAPAENSPSASASQSQSAEASPSADTEKSNLTIVGSTSVGPYMEEIAKMYEEQNEGVSISVQQIGSGQGIAAAMDGTADIGMSSRELKDDEKGELTEYKLCIDGIGVIVHPDNRCV